jgi:hypothetical protein
MTGTAAKAITDEMVSPRLADALRMRGYDVSSCHSEGRANRGIADEAHLAFATVQGRAIYTFNGTDFRKIHHLWQSLGREHAGIIISEDPNRNFAEMIRRMQVHLTTVDAAAQWNRIWVLRP